MAALYYIQMQICNNYGIMGKAGQYVYVMECVTS